MTQSITSPCVMELTKVGFMAQSNIPSWNKEPTKVGFMAQSNTPSRVKGLTKGENLSLSSLLSFILLKV